ncbi:MAG: peptidoglycan bridge formation glycyltransferase FemA/FemB family protein [Candidatus Dojkabacteria bacterium]|jgi:lipid II:glycine glycyltransferase (peptidoglycan interpeptide bridge formation enzyme)|nr:peptidoglycan bridge formation glycyltransferase FemA/FemB family protein [Candidatus Dojkabacteria bacterium]MDD2269994.1 peptidoglycan bridge formation glycyltransferase FemA/FemB family protein [Candidatus Dojkabacteria bacterium]
MQTIEIKNQQEWDRLLGQCERKTFLQTWQWGEFQEYLGYEIKRLVFFNNEKFLGLTLCIINKSRFERYVYCPRGPLLSKDNSEIYAQALGALKEFWEKKHISTLKVDPAFLRDSKISKLPQKCGFKHTVNFIQSENNWMIDLVGENEEDLLRWCKEHGMSKNYPTYIRKARHSGIEIEFSKEQKDWDLFHTYLKYSGQRKEFEVKSKRYHIGMWECLGKDSDILRLGIAKRNGKILAMIVISSYGDEVSALYSAQTGVDSRLRATMLLRWECMLLGQREGFKRFNSWGVLPEKKYTPKNPGFGYSQYKRGFGGYLEEIERTYEYVFNKALHPLQKLYDFYLKLRYYRFR